MVTNLSNGDSSASVARWLPLYCWTLNCTALICRTENGQSSHMASERTHREHRLRHLVYCCMMSPRTRMLRQLHSNGCKHHVSWHILYCCLRALPSNGLCLQNHIWATSLYDTVWLQNVVYAGNVRTMRSSYRHTTYIFPGILARDRNYVCGI
jgi:hypothetical protein